MSVSWTCDDFVQVLTLSSQVLRHVSRYRQYRASAKEAGGQLFGTVEHRLVRVSVATGPYSGDDRTRFSYRSSPAAAARAVNVQESRGLLYLGEWHTHAEGRPEPSGEDVATMSGLVLRSELAAGAAMLLIVGTESVPAGLYLGTFEKDRFRRWAAVPARRRWFHLSRWSG